MQGQLPAPVPRSRVQRSRRRISERSAHDRDVRATAARFWRAVPGGVRMGAYAVAVGVVFDFIFHRAGQHVAQCCGTGVYGHLLTLVGIGLTAASIAHAIFSRYRRPRESSALIRLAALVLTARTMRRPHEPRRHW